MSKQKGLGKGLGALLGDFAMQEQAGGISTLSIHKIEPNLQQPRKVFDDEQLQALADSIAENGIIQPIAVRELEGGYYQIVAGERRWRAARLAGLTEIPAVILEADEQKTMELAMIENLQRQDLNPVEEAQGYQVLATQYGLSHEQIARQVGKSRPAVANSLRLLQLEPSVLQMLKDGTLSAGHARAVLQLSEPKLEKAAAQKICALGLSVRQAERLCKQMAQEQKKPEQKQPETVQVDYIAECERSLSQHLGRGVKIIQGRKKGRFELEFYGQEDLQQLLDALLTLGGIEQ